LIKGNFSNALNLNIDISICFYRAKLIKILFFSLTPPKKTPFIKILENILNVEIGLTFSRVLEDAGVFKRDKKGKNAFLKFINHIGGRF